MEKTALQISVRGVGGAGSAEVVIPGACPSQRGQQWGIWFLAQQLGVPQLIAPWMWKFPVCSLAFPWKGG